MIRLRKLPKANGGVAARLVLALPGGVCMGKIRISTTRVRRVRARCILAMTGGGLGKLDIGTVRGEVEARWIPAWPVWGPGPR